MIGAPCDSEGQTLPSGSPAPTPAEPESLRNLNVFDPFENRVHYQLTDFFYCRNKISKKEFDDLMQLWAATGVTPPFANYNKYLDTIDSIPHGEVPWQSFKVKYSGDRPDKDVPPWMDTEYDVWFCCPCQIARNHLANPDFAKDVDWAPKRVFNQQGKREWCDFMLGNWAWRQADKIAEDSKTQGAAFCPIILGSDKTTVSVASQQASSRTPFVVLTKTLSLL
ncbi:hypothetical protein PHLGIDRAFT_123204 [Phlebiopsis gigantea 11061_1 CR5-6]|uniref:Uncharacterized protein n=1 Tax=Phlebiopsis gigantea (strain 11061_1 CR5-6) TaxID=745531 RepID=A0A0C3PA25_PHLG1|nr:hypothetical protein PHLGIDRAFT_123204 [Phlebiopsis gigantea 11061_1 CR5-6]